MLPFPRKYLSVKPLLLALVTAFLFVSGAFAADGSSTEGKGGAFTLWPLLDYRESPPEGFRSLSLLGPLFKLQHQQQKQILAIRPFLYKTSDEKDGSTATQYLYPLASSQSSPEASTIQVLKLFQKNVYHENKDDEPDDRFTMLFPLYISGTSEKYGPYTSIFPLYGDIYERFWRDEYHFVLFPLYGRTVRKGITTRNYLYPFFSTISGENESGFQFWPLYGQSAKEGAYQKRFFLWPFFMREESGLNTDNPTSKSYVLPFYARIDTAKSSARYYLWPFFGHKSSYAPKEEEWDYFWPFLRTIRGERRNLTSFMPVYLRDERPESSKTWIMWPILKHEEIHSDTFQQERDRILYFLYSDNRERWPKDGAQRRRMALWPLFVYAKQTSGVKSISLPAPVEPVLDREGIEKLWAPLWRIYQQRWHDNGDSAASLLWNLYWHERRGKDLAFELFPFIDYRSEQRISDIKLLKGLLRYRNHSGAKTLNLFWLPFGPSWGAAAGTLNSTVGSTP